MYEIGQYRKNNGTSPFEEWYESLKDIKIKVKIATRLDRVKLGNFGDFKSLKGGLYELREHYSPGYRIYYGLSDGSNKLVLLLAGSTKGDQEKMIKTARKYLTDWRNRQNECHKTV